MNISITGPKILFTIPVLGGIPVTETVVNSWIVMVLITLFCIWITGGMTVDNPSRKQLAAEKIVMLFSAISSLLSITGLRSPTADYSVTLAMALVTFTLIQYYNLKSKGPIGFFKRFTEPVAVMTPINVLSEVATPVSMSLRHFGNIASGLVITGLVYGGLTVLSRAVLGWIPNDFLANIPIFQVGVPAILSIYFDVFTSAMQAYIFCMLTMVYVSGAVD